MRLTQLLEVQSGDTAIQTAAAGTVIPEVLTPTARAKDSTANLSEKPAPKR